MNILEFALDDKLRLSSSYFRKSPYSVRACTVVTALLFCGCSHLNEANKDKVITAQQAEIEALQHKIKCRDSRIITMEKHIKVLEKKLFPLPTEDGPGKPNSSEF